MYKKIGDVLVGVICVVMLAATLLPPIAFGVIGCVEVCWFMLVGVVGFLFMSFGGADWIHDTFAKLDSTLSTSHCLETKCISQTQIAGDNAVQVQSAGRSHLDSPVLPAGLEDRKEFLDVLRRRRDRFATQIDFWERMDGRKYRDLRIIGLTEIGSVYGMQMAMECVDVELLLEVLKATAAEYDRLIATLEAEIENCQ